jgi:hypothetical protein
MRNNLKKISLIFGFSVFCFVMMFVSYANAQALPTTTPDCNDPLFEFTPACTSRLPTPTLTRCEIDRTAYGCPGSVATPGAPVSRDECNNPFSDVYTTQDCVKKRLGLTEVQANTIVIARDPNSLIVVGFRAFLWIIVIVTIARILWKSFQVGAAANDADKRKELFIEIIWIIVAMVGALGGLGITFAVQQFAFGESFDDQVINCEDLPDGASQDIINRCTAILG